MKVGNICNFRTISSFLISVTIVFTVQHADGSDGFVSFFGHAFLRSQASTTVMKTKPCNCRNDCYLDPDCAIASVTRVTNGVFACLLTREMNTSLLHEEEYAVTWVMKRNLECSSPFNLVNGVGCIYIPDSSANYSQVRDLCPVNSDLYSPATMGIFENLRQHLIKLKNAGEMSHFRLYLGVQRNDSRAFVWRTGGFISGNDPNNPTEISPGTYPFYGNDPNQPEYKCVFMQKTIDYLLYDATCSSICHVICQLN